MMKTCALQTNVLNLTYQLQIHSSCQTKVLIATLTFSVSTLDLTWLLFGSICLAANKQTKQVGWRFNTDRLCLKIMKDLHIKCNNIKVPIEQNPANAIVVSIMTSSQETWKTCMATNWQKHSLVTEHIQTEGMYVNLNESGMNTKT